MYHWRQNGNPIGGATAATLTLSNVSGAHAGTCFVDASNVVGTVAGAGAVLTVAGGPVTPPKFTNVKRSGPTFTLTLPTRAGKDHILEYKSSVSDPSWAPLQTLPGTGSPVSFTDTTATNQTRFYRIRF